MTRKRQTPHKKHVFIHRASSIGTVLPPPKREEKNQEDRNFRFFFVQSVPNETGGNGVRFWVPTVVPPVGISRVRERGGGSGVHLSERERTSDAVIGRVVRSRRGDEKYHLLEDVCESLRARFLREHVRTSERNVRERVHWEQQQLRSRARRRVGFTVRERNVRKSVLDGWNALLAKPGERNERNQKGVETVREERRRRLGRFVQHGRVAAERQRDERDVQMGDE